MIRFVTIKIYHSLHLSDSAHCTETHANKLSLSLYIHIYITLGYVALKRANFSSADGNEKFVYKGTNSYTISDTVTCCLFLIAIGWLSLTSVRNSAVCCSQSPHNVLYAVWTGNQ